jgi:DNA-binding transcriptional LysR family regulator
VVICLSQDHPLARRKSVRLSELSGESFLMLTQDYMFRGIVDDCCRKAGFRPKTVFESSQWDMLYDMVAANFGITFLPRWLVEKWEKPQVRILSVEEPRIPWILSLCYSRNRFLTEPMKKFLEICLRSQ